MALHHFPRIVTDGLVLCLDAGNPLSYPGSGNAWTDLSGNGNSGTLGNHIFTSDNKGSISFNGSSTTCLISASEYLKSATAPLTIIAWAYQDTYSGRCIFAQFNSTTNYRLTKMLRIDSSDMVYFHGLNDGGFSEVRKSGIELNRWNYFTVTVSGTPTNAILQVGCNLSYSSYVARSSLSSTPDTTVPIVIGSNSVYGENWDGNISTVMFYNRALSQDDLLKNYLATKGRYGL